MPDSYDELDHQASEFVNCIYQDDRPFGWATDFVSGLKRFYPRCRRKLETATAYMRNWQKTTIRVRALPVTSEMLCGMAAVAFMRGKPRIAETLLVGYAALLRAGEMVEMELHQITILNDHLAVLAFPDSKGAQRKGQIESVFVRDPRLVARLQARKSTGSDHDRFYGGSYTDLTNDIKSLARFFGLVHPNLTPYCVRRGGATWFFTKTWSYDATQRHGRWVHARTAQTYIDEAMAESGTALLSKSGKSRLSAAVRVLPTLM